MPMRGHGAKRGSNVLTTLTTPDLNGAWPRSQSAMRSVRIGTRFSPGRR